MDSRCIIFNQEKKRKSSEEPHGKDQISKTLHVTSKQILHQMKADWYHGLTEHLNQTTGQGSMNY